MIVQQPRAAAIGRQTPGLPIAVSLCGAAAGRVLLQPGGGRVIAVFRRSFYLGRDDGGLACVGPQSMGAGPLNALCRLTPAIDWCAAGLHPGLSWSVQASTISVADRFGFSLASATTWRAPGTPTLDAAGVARGLIALRALAATRAPTAGLGPLLRLLPETPALYRDWLHNPHAEFTTNGPAIQRLLLQQALPAIRSLLQWLALDCRSPLPTDAARLIGLGPGLTPSGDDFIGGLLLALHLAGTSTIADRLAGVVLSAAPARTNRISNAHLNCAAEGEVAAPLHAVAAAIFAGAGRQLGTVLADIDSIGHCSGWDAVTGLAYGGMALLSSEAIG